MGSSASMYDVRLDGERVTNLPKTLCEPLQMIMNGHQTLIIVRKPEITERSRDIDENSSVMRETIERLEDVINTRQSQITEMFNSSIVSLNNQLEDLKNVVDNSAKRPNDTISIASTFELLASRVNDIANTLPLTLSEKFNNQTDRLIDSINDVLHPKDSINATIKGAQYELEVVQGLESLKMTGLSIERVSTETAVCDIHAIDTDNNIFYAIECKNYSSKSVSKTEVDKFYRDLEHLKQMHSGRYNAIIGLFLSKQTSIVGHGLLDFDNDGNVFLACEYNNPMMWKALMVYFAKVKRVESIKPTSSDDHMKIMVAVYNAMREAESVRDLINKNVERLNDSIKDLKTMSEKIKPISDIIDKYAVIYGLSIVSEKNETKPKKTRAKKPVVAQEPETLDDDEEQLDIPPESENESDKVVLEPKPKRKYTKRQKRLDETNDANNNSSVGWSDEE